MSNVIYSKLIIHPQYIPEWYNSYTMGVTSAAGTDIIMAYVQVHTCMYGQVIISLLF
jgi:hypothetical protein